MGTVREMKMSKPWLLYSNYSPVHLADFTVLGKSSGQYSSCPKRGKIEDFRYSGEAETTCG